LWFYLFLFRVFKQVEQTFSFTLPTFLACKLGDCFLFVAILEWLLDIAGRGFLWQISQLFDIFFTKNSNFNSPGQWTPAYPRKYIK